jgi:hypothetical protein
MCFLSRTGFGPGFVTLVALPLARAQSDPRKAWALFEAIEIRFARQVRWSIPLAGATGLWTVWRMELWQRFADASFGGCTPWFSSGRCS